MNQNERPRFATRFGVIATTVGSAVGLGNIWRFPYEAGANGGGAFLLLYIIFVAAIGVPVVCAEFIMGRSSRLNIFGAFRSLAPRSGKAWVIVGCLGILSSILILSFYSVVAGWTLEYLYESLAGKIDNMGGVSRQTAFDTFTAGWGCVGWTLVVLAINAFVLLGGVRKGIERASNILMPILFAILIILCVNSLLLPNAAEGLHFLFAPDFGAIDSGVVISALGQAFFSLSLGVGTMMIYGSYFDERTPIVRSAATTAGLDTLVAIMAGILIFPAVFSFGGSRSKTRIRSPSRHIRDDARRQHLGLGILLATRPRLDNIHDINERNMRGLPMRTMGHEAPRRCSRQRRSSHGLRQCMRTLIRPFGGYENIWHEHVRPLRLYHQQYIHAPQRHVDSNIHRLGAQAQHYQPRISASTPRTYQYHSILSPLRSTRRHSPNIYQRPTVKTDYIPR